MALLDHTLFLRPVRIALSIALLMTTCANAQEFDRTTGKRPAGANRVVRAFDFEEQEINPLPVPLGWIRAQNDPAVPRLRPGFPIWNGAELDYKSPAYSGIGSVMLPTHGGSTSLLLRYGELSIFQNADYLVSARVRTQDIVHSKARLVARFLDQQGIQIEGGEESTPLVNTMGEWQQISLEIEGIYPDAAFIEIELQLLQPKEQHDLADAPAFTVFDEDFQGKAFFDNLIIAQLPRLEISTGHPGNIVESQTAPPIRVLVRDLTGDSIVAQIRVFDTGAREVDSQIIADGTRRVEVDWTPNLPGFGWYRAILEVVVNEQLVGIRTLEFIWAAPSEQDADSGMFSIHADLTNPKIAMSAPGLVKGAGVSRASMNIWSYNTTKELLSPDSPSMLAVNELLKMGTKLSLGFAELPKGLANELAIDPDEVLPVMAGPPTPWLNWGGEMLDHYGQAIIHWQFGEQPTQEKTQTLNPQLDAIRTSLIGYVPGPVIKTPWSIDRTIEPEIIGPSRQLLVIENQVSTEETMALIVDDWVKIVNALPTPKDRMLSELGMKITPGYEANNWSGIEISSAVGALARKAISFWWQATSSPYDNKQFLLELDDAWWISPGKRGQVMPAPELVVWKTLASRLGTRRAIEKLDLIEGVHALIASPKADPNSESQGIMILWLDEPTLEPAIINLPLSMNTVTQYDMFNNQTQIPVERIGELSLPVHRVQVTRTPIIIEGVNTDLVRFLNALKITPDRLQAKSGVHNHAVKLTNPWPISVRGKLFILEPGGYSDPNGIIDRSWEIKPRVMPFILEANQTLQIPLEIAYSLGELAGDKKLVFDIELQADEDYPLIRIERTIELGLDGIEMILSAKRSPTGVTVVSAQVTNNLDINQDFEVIAIPPNEARIRRSINGIKPGERVTREFAFTKVKSGDEVVITLMLRETSTRLNQTVMVP